MNNNKIFMRHTFHIQALGSPWHFTIEGDITPTVLQSLNATLLEEIDSFENEFSRFRKNSFNRRLSQKKGTVKVSERFMQMMKYAFEVYESTEGMLDITIGESLTSMGYDETYSLQPAQKIFYTKGLPYYVSIIDENHISIKEHVLFDFGSFGKGYMIDACKNIMQEMLKDQNVLRMYIDGSGDILHYSFDPHEGHALKVGLEDPDDSKNILGVFELNNASLASSATNRRAWRGYSHIIDPKYPETSNTDAKYKAIWVKGKSTLYADAFATAFFNMSPSDIEKIATKYRLSYALLDTDRVMTVSNDWNIKLY